MDRHLLFGIPLLPAGLLTGVGSFGILAMRRRGFRPLEAVISSLIGVIILGFAFQMFYAQPEADRILAGLFTPKFAGTESVLLASGILGATVMPHVIYLLRVGGLLQGRGAHGRLRLQLNLMSSKIVSWWNSTNLCSLIVSR